MKHLKKLIALAMVAATVLAVAVPAMAAYSTMYVNVGAGQTVRLRASASTSGTVLINVPHGTAVQAENYNSTWHKVKYSGYTGYMMSSFLTSSNPADDGWKARYGDGVMNKYSDTQHITNLQRDLMGLSISVGPTGDDGIYGDKTIAGIREFQTRFGLTVDGYAGPATKSTLFNARIP